MCSGSRPAVLAESEPGLVQGHGTWCQAATDGLAPGVLSGRTRLANNRASNRRPGYPPGSGQAGPLSRVRRSNLSRAGTCPRDWAREPTCSTTPGRAAQALAALDPALAALPGSRDTVQTLPQRTQVSEPAPDLTTGTSSATVSTEANPSSSLSAVPETRGVPSDSDSATQTVARAGV